MNHVSSDCREAALSEEAKKHLCEALTNEDCAQGAVINWSSEVLRNYGQMMPLPLSGLTAAFLNCFINGIMTGIDVSNLKVPKEDARLAIGANCLEAVDRTLDQLRGGKTDE